LDTLAAEERRGMTIVNRRNALIGWSVLKIGKVVAKRKAKEAVPGTGDHHGLNKSAIATIAATAGGALFVWRKKARSSTAE
jgi:hypothetical protein